MITDGDTGLAQGGEAGHVVPATLHRGIDRRALTPGNPVSRLGLLAVILLAWGLGGCGSAPVKAPISASPPQTTHPVVRASKALLGTPYRWGGNSPREGFDCSGLVWYVYRQAGVQLPRTANEQYARLPAVHPQRMRPGDLLFFLLPRQESLHVALYVGERRFIHAPSSGKRVSYANLDNPFWGKRLVDVRRVVGTRRMERVHAAGISPLPARDPSLQQDLAAR